MKIFTNVELRHLSKAFRNTHGADIVLDAKRKYVKKLAAEFNLTEQSGLLTVPADKKHVIRSKIEQEHSLKNLLDTESIKALSRIEQAKKYQNEKADASAPNKNYILARGLIPLKSGSTITANEYSIRINLSELELSAISEVIVIENLAAFDHAVKCAEFNSQASTMIYRGNGVDTKAVQNLLRHQRSTLLQCGYLNIPL